MLLLLFLLATAGQLFFWGYFLRGAFHNGFVPDKSTTATPLPLSVIVCFYNEEQHLEQCVAQILKQVYPDGFELILVDDNSTDGSTSIAQTLAIQDERVQLLHPGQTRPGKKDALAYGIAHASYDSLVLTDADCVPATDHWLYFMAAPLRDAAELVLGVSAYASEYPFSFRSGWQRYENFYTALKYLGFARQGRPYMGVGRNLAYRKSLYERAGGFSSHADVPGGDDDLLINAAADPTRTERGVHPAAWTYSASQPTWTAYFRQRWRHQFAGGRYRAGHQLLLGLLALSHGLFYLLGAYLLLAGWWVVGVVAYALRWPLLYTAFRDPYLNANPQAYRGAGSGAKGGCLGKVYLAVTISLHDLFVGPMYLFLAIAGQFRPKGW